MDTVAATTAKPLVVEIDGTAAHAQAFAARSNKCSPGDMMEGGRADFAAPPTEASCPGTFTFADFLDTINPLQHIPVLSAAYRAMTGDTISPTSNIAGGVLYGGPLGGLLSLAGSMFDVLQGVDSTDTAKLADSSAATPSVSQG